MGKKEQYINEAADIVLGRMVSENIDAVDEVSKAKFITEILDYTKISISEYSKIFEEILNKLNNTINRVLFENDIN